MDLSTAAQELDQREDLDRFVEPLQRATDTVLRPGPLTDALRGRWLGHAVHPPLTDLAIGFWTSAFVLDVFGGRRARPGADALVGLGVAAAIPTAVTGWADWTTLPAAKKRTGVVHAAANVTATSLYALSFVARRRGQRIRGVAMAMAGSAAATFGGYLGGHLAFGEPDGETEAEVTHVDDRQQPSALASISAGDA